MSVDELKEGDCLMLHGTYKGLSGYDGLHYVLLDGADVPTALLAAELGRGRRLEPRYVLDACCGSRMFWHDRKDARVVFMDCREVETTLCDGRRLEIRPDVVGDFRRMPFPDARFRLVVFDPPHTFAGERSWLAQKYGRLDRGSWREDLRAGFRECFRVLEPRGTLVFKWCSTDIPLSEVLQLAPCPPLLGTQGGRQGKTHFLIFMKGDDD